MGTPVELSSRSVVDAQPRDAHTEVGQWGGVGELGI